MSFGATKPPRITYLHHPLLSKPYPYTRNVTQKKFEDALSYEAKPGDIFICAYAKCGSSWLQNALTTMRRDGEPLGPGEFVFDYTPFLDFVGKDAVENTKHLPRVIKTHFYQELVPWNDEAKYINIARNPKDCFASFYHHTVGFETAYDFKDGKFEDYFEKIIQGDVDFGDYFKHAPEWWEKSKQKDNVLFVLYEDLKEHMEREFLRIVEFIEGDWEEKVKANNGIVLKKMVEHCEFRNMKERNNLFKTEGFLYRPAEKPFIRKGIIGDWKTLFTEDQSKRVDRRMEEAGLKYPGFEHIWDEYYDHLHF